MPQNIRFPTDSSLLNEAREKAEEIIDILHEHGMTEGRKPRTYRKVARKQYNSFSKARKKSGRMIRKVVRQQLGYLKRDLGYIDAIVKKHPDCLKQVLSRYKAQSLEVIRLLFTQQQEMFRKNTHRVENRIVSISQPWVRPIVRGKQNAEVEFGAKVEMSVVNGFLRIESLRYFRESVFKPLMAKLGIAEGKVPYGARHTYSDKLKKAGDDDKAKAALMGHTNYDFTRQKYQSTSVEDLQNVVNSIT